MEGRQVALLGLWARTPLLLTRLPPDMLLGMPATLAGMPHVAMRCDVILIIGFNVNSEDRPVISKHMLRRVLWLQLSISFLTKRALPVICFLQVC